MYHLSVVIEPVSVCVVVADVDADAARICATRLLVIGLSCLCCVFLFGVEICFVFSTRNQAVLLWLAVVVLVTGPLVHPSSGLRHAGVRRCVALIGTETVARRVDYQARAV